MAETRRETLFRLFEQYNLTFDKANPESKDNDVYKHKHYTVITRQGIQKIEKIAGIVCDITIVFAGAGYCYVSGVGTTKEGVRYQTLASATAENSQNKYYAEMAEKRCRSRLILTLAGLYEQGGIFGQDELPEDDHDVPKTATIKSEKR